MGAKEFEVAVHCFELATGREAWAAWDRKTLRERRNWLRQFASTVDRLLVLVNEGPVPPVVSGGLVQDYVLVELLRRLSVPFPDDYNSEAFYIAMQEANAAVEDLPWNIADALLDYRRRVSLEAMQGDFINARKPGDPKAGRARFVVNFRAHSGCSVPVVATVAAVMFDDESIDERLVRRLTRPRVDS